MGVFRDVTGLTPKYFFTVKKPKLSKNRTRFSATPEIPTQHAFLATPLLAINLIFFLSVVGSRLLLAIGFSNESSVVQWRFYIRARGG